MMSPFPAVRRGARSGARLGLGCGMGALLALLAGCASIPKEAPGLSAELGSRVSALEASHLALLSQFFDEKRAAVDRYIDDVWIPTYSEEVMKEPAIASLWTQVCHEGTDRDRLEFLRRVGTGIQRRVNAQRQAMIAPLDELERAVATRLRTEYDQARALNNTLTSFLSSAAQVEANRQRYLEMLGLHEADVEAALAGAEEATGVLAEHAGRVDQAVKDADAFKEKLRETLSRLTETSAPK